MLLSLWYLLYESFQQILFSTRTFCVYTYPYNGFAVGRFYETVWLYYVTFR